MKLNWKSTLGGLALAAMALPVWAHTESLDYLATQPTTIGNYQLAPGEYQLKADDVKNEVTVEQGGFVITQVPCKWVQLQQKANSTEVQTSDTGVTQLTFAGKTEAVTFAQ
jgi:hypothetical protein